jgi:predicted nucleotidyltransferase
LITPLPVSGTPAQRALLGSIVAAYAGDQRVLAVGILGSLARGTGDAWSDLDLDLVLADGVVLDAVAEARALCQHLGLTETLVVSSRPGEVDVVLPSLEQFSIRYHPLGTTNAHIVDDLKILSGRLDRAGAPDGADRIGGAALRAQRRDGRAARQRLAGTARARRAALAVAGAVRRQSRAAAPGARD